MYRTASLCSELPSCDRRCTPAVEEEDYEVMYSIDGTTKLSISGTHRASSLPYFSLVVPLVALASTVVTPIRLYPLYCTLYCTCI
jgi:hypothetical protein